MHQSMMARHKDFSGWLVALLWLTVQCPKAIGQDALDRGPAADPLLASTEWKLHEKSAQILLGKASECLDRTLQSEKTKCDPSLFLKQAGDEYGYMESILAGTQGHVDAAALVANGFVRSGLLVRAIGFLSSRKETETDPVLLHLLADTLFAMGDFPNAGKAYRTWIATGCHGYIYSLQDKGYWVVPLKGDPCAYLPEPLRSRLELLKESAGGEPRNLPEKNDPAVVFPAPWD